MLDVVLAVAIGLATVLDAVRGLRRATRIRDGWVHKDFKSTREEFLERTRRGYTRLSWVGLAGGVLFLAFVGLWFAVAGHYERFMLFGLFLGLSFLSSGIVSLWSRRILDSPRQATQPGG